MDQSLVAKFSDIKKFVKEGEKLRKFKGDTEITIMYFIMKVYPQAFNNFQKMITDQYTQGYIAGKKDGLAEKGVNNEN